MNPMRELERALRQFTLEAVRQGLPFSEVERQLAELLRKHGFVGAQASALSAEMLATAQAQFEWIAARTLDPFSRHALQTILVSSGPQFALVGGAIHKRTLDVVARGLREGLTQREIEDDLLHRLKKPKAHARTISNSALQAFGRANTFRLASESGIERFRYAGPPGERAFCADMMAKSRSGKTWTREEIGRLSNGQGLPVQLYCGGYNCRHFWEVAIPTVDDAIRDLYGEAE